MNTGKTATCAWWDAVTLVTLVAIICVGLGVLVGWHLHVRVLVQVLPGVIPMQYNTALCFFVLGASAWARVARRGHPLLPAVGGVLVAVMGALVIFEYATGSAIGIDTAFFYPWERTFSADPGRMALTSAISFASAGGALAMLVWRPRALALCAIMHTLPLSLGLASVLGYLFGITYVLPFRLGSQMAIHTALAFMAYGTVMLSYAWRRTSLTEEELPRLSLALALLIVPVFFVIFSITTQRSSTFAKSVQLFISLLSASLVGLGVRQLTKWKIAYQGLLLISVPLVFALAFIALVTELQRGNEQAQARSSNSKEVIAQTQVLLRNLVDAETSIRGYIITGNPVFTEPYDQAIQETPKAARQLNILVQDNPEQKERAARLAVKASVRLAYIAEIKRLMRAGARDQAVERVKSGQGKQLMDEFRREIASFLQEEERLDMAGRLALEGSWQRFNWLLVAGTAVDILLTLLLAFLFSRGINSRVLTLTENAQRLAAGKELVPALTGTDEIAQLDHVFHDMALALAEAARKEQALVENALDVICTADTEGKFVRVSPASLKVWGYRPEELVGRRYLELVAPEDVAKTTQMSSEIMAGQVVTDFENRYQHKDGSLVNVLWSARWSETEQLIFCVARDITERKRAEEALQKAHNELEQRVAERTSELAQAKESVEAYAASLERSNRELQDFAYVASHDLQEPLRKIQAFGDRLKTKCGEALSEQGHDYLERMQGAAGRMQTLINDLLAFSRVTTKARPFASVNLDELARGVMSDLETQIERTGGRVELGELPIIEADSLQMRQLLQNLIGNALKFHRVAEAPVVKVYGQLLNGWQKGPLGDAASAGLCQLLVEDNGIGFDEKYLDRIFTPFQRLHGRNEYEGSGIGLAICRKIVERHGGSLTARSTPGQGSTFVVTLPVTHPKGDQSK